MSSRPSTAWQSGSGLPSPRAQADRNPTPRNLDLERPLPPLPPSSSLPDSYEIPALRRKPAPEIPSSTSVKHNRSVSHPFPLFFGGKKLDKKLNDDDFDSSDSGSPSRRDTQKSKTGLAPSTTPTPNTERQPVTGRCMTCDSTVRWPQGLKVFRCTTCLTVNDLEPFDEPSGTPFGERQVLAQKPMPISVERTRSLIDHCLNEYMRQQLDVGARGTGPPPLGEMRPHAHDEGMAANSDIHFDTVASSPAGPSMYTRARDRTISRSGVVKSVQDRDNMPSGNTTSDLPDKMPVSPSRPRQHHIREISRNDTDTAFAYKDPSLSIFRALESYISGCFTGCANMNMSFFLIKPGRETSDQDVKTSKSMGESSSTPQFDPDSFISEFDAKTLLLGDVAENGSWWTGRTDRNESVNDDRIPVA